jgi:hypothetical protein
MTSSGASEVDEIGADLPNEAVGVHEARKLAREFMAEAGTSEVDESNSSRPQIKRAAPVAAGADLTRLARGRQCGSNDTRACTGRARRALKDPGLATAPGSSIEAGAVAKRGICLNS